MKKYGWKEKLSYSFDRILSKSPLYMILMLFTFTTACVLLLGSIAYFISDDGGWLYQLWMSLMHTLDAGNLAGNETSNVPYLIMMSLATICGLFVTSILIGIITTGFENKLESLKKGTSVVQVSGQTTIIGFNNNIYTLLTELIEANRSKKKSYIVVLGDIPKEEMEDAISSHIQNTYTTEIICRSGRLFEMHSLELCSLETSQSVIVNTTDDTETIKILLAISAYVKNTTLYNKDLSYITSIQDEENFESARMASEDRAIIIHTADAIARIIVNTCRQHGLSEVLTELFDFGGDEMYIEKIPEFVGKTFGEAVVSLKNSTLIGIANDEGGYLNPHMDKVITENDGLVLIEEDDGVFQIDNAPKIDETVIVNNSSEKNESNNNLIILGTNNKLSVILEEYDKYVKNGTKVTIIDDDFDAGLIGTYNNIEVSISQQRISREFLISLTEDGTKNILLLNDDSNDTEKSDSITLVNLLLLRDITNKTGKKFSITSEMHHVENQKLADSIHVDDFVISSNLSSLLMAQLSESKHLAPIIDDLLDEDGSELYIKTASNYVKLGVPVNMYTLTKSAALKGEIFVGYRIVRSDKVDLQVNPMKDAVVSFEEGDQLIVIAED